MSSGHQQAPLISEAARRESVVGGLAFSSGAIREFVSDVEDAVSKGLSAAQVELMFRAFMLADGIEVFFRE